MKESSDGEEMLTVMSCIIIAGLWQRNALTTAEGRAGMVADAVDLALRVEAEVARAIKERKS